MYTPAELPSLSLSASAHIVMAAGPAENIVAVCDWASSHGAVGIGAFAACHMAAVVVCFPATILFELAAGFAFGIYQGALIAWAAKVSAALLTFLISSGIARTALSNAGVEARARGPAPEHGQTRVTRLGVDVWLLRHTPAWGQCPRSKTTAPLDTSGYSG